MIDIINFNYQVIKNNNIYTINKFNNNYIFKRIDTNNYYIDIIELINDNVLIKNNKMILNEYEKDILIDDIFNVLYNTNNVKDFISLEDIFYKIKNSYKNIKKYVKILK